MDRRKSKKIHHRKRWVDQTCVFITRTKQLLLNLEWTGRANGRLFDRMSRSIWKAIQAYRYCSCWYFSVRDGDEVFPRKIVEEAEVRPAGLIVSWGFLGESWRIQRVYQQYWVPFSYIHEIYTKILHKRLASRSIVEALLRPRKWLKQFSIGTRRPRPQFGWIWYIYHDRKIFLRFLLTSLTLLTHPLHYTYRSTFNNAKGSRRFFSSPSNTVRSCSINLSKL